MRPGKRNLITDVPGLRVGNAEDRAIKSGVTVLTADQPFVAAVDVMGGAPGTRETDLLDADKSTEAVDALVLSGGSAYGLDAASGVTDALRAAGRGFAVGPALVPLVPAAILFDLLNGGAKDWAENPYRALGHSAYEAADVSFELGSHGAGTGALTSDCKGGLGSASLVLDSGVTVGALVGVNPFGSVQTANGHLWAAPFEIGAEFGGKGADPAGGQVAAFTSQKAQAFLSRTNTTIAVVATDAALTKAQAKRVAVMAQDGIGRAIVPAHSPYDGDLIFAAATGAQPLGADSAHAILDIGHAAALCLARAIGRGVYEARPEAGDILPCWQKNSDRP